MITRSGTNQFHGSMLENFQSDAFASRDRFLQYNNPNTTVTSPAFGLITSVASTRTGQVGLRLTF